MLKIVTLKTGNTSWWKNIKYRREAAADLKSCKENFAFGTETPISEIALALKDKKIGAVPIVDEDNKLFKSFSKNIKKSNCVPNFLYCL